MNTKFTFASIVLVMFLIATACSPEISSLPNLDPAQPVEESNEIAPLVPIVPVTGVNASNEAYSLEQEYLAYPSQKSHSNCVSDDIQRQNMCMEKGPNAVIRHSDAAQTEAQEYPIQKLHSHCVSTDVNRQNYCTD